MVLLDIYNGVWFLQIHFADESFTKTPERCDHLLKFTKQMIWVLQIFGQPLWCTHFFFSFSLCVHSKDNTATAIKLVSIEFCTATMIKPSGTTALMHQINRVLYPRTTNVNDVRLQATQKYHIIRSQRQQQFAGCVCMSPCNLVTVLDTFTCTTLTPKNYDFFWKLKLTTAS